MASTCLQVTHSQAFPCSRQVVRDVAHALATACHHNVMQAELYALSAQHDSLHARRADLVDCCAYGGVGQPRAQSSLPCRCLRMMSSSGWVQCAVKNPWRVYCMSY